MPSLPRIIEHAGSHSEPSGASLLSSTRYMSLSTLLMSELITARTHGLPGRNRSVSARLLAAFTAAPAAVHSLSRSRPRSLFALLARPTAALPQPM